MARNTKPQKPNADQQRFNAPKFGKPGKGPIPEPLGKIRPRHTAIDPAIMGAADNRYEKRCLRCDRELEHHEHPVCCKREDPA